MAHFAEKVRFDSIPFSIFEILKHLCARKKKKGKKKKNSTHNEKNIYYSRIAVYFERFFRFPVDLNIKVHGTRNDLSWQSKRNDI